jgi:hypothetical protein
MCGGGLVMVTKFPELTNLRYVYTQQVTQRSDRV